MQENLREAERRIEEARRTRAEVLDLGDLALSELPASLGDLPELRTLYLGRDQPSEDGEPKAVYAREDSNFTDLTPLVGLQSLQSLNLAGCRGVTDLAPIVGFQTLQSLILTATGVTDLAPVAALQALQSLDLSGTSVMDLAPLSRVQALRSLDLAGSNVTDLAPIAGLQALRTLSLDGTLIADLTPIAGLTALERLNLTGSLVVDLGPLARLQALQNLELAQLGVTDLAPIAGLDSLLELDLAHCPRVADLTPIAGLKTLQILYLNDTSVMDLTPIMELKYLKELDLVRTGVMNLTPVEGLTALQSLDLSYTGVTDLFPIAALKNLAWLDLSRTLIADLSPIAKLQSLEVLKLTNTSVMELPPMAGLTCLQRLYLAGTDVMDLTPIAGLPALEILDVSYTDVVDLTPLVGLQTLTNLYLSDSRVTDLSPITSLQNLQRLDFQRTGVTDLTPLNELKALTALDLFGWRPSIPAPLLRALVSQPAMTELVADEAAGVPREVLSRKPHDDCLPRLRAYFAELDLGAEAENEVKLILLGNGRVGKTQLCRRFRGEPFDADIRSTHGVQIWREELRLSSGSEEKFFQVNWWDFGGQDIYHGTHALFLRSRAVFLILWTPSLENREEFEENGIPLRNQPLAYWLDYVRSLAGAGSPVIVVQSQCDRFADQRPAPSIPEALGFVQCCFYSAKEDIGRETLESQLRNAIGYLVEQNGKLEIGRGRAEVRRRLYAWRTADQQREPAERQHRTLTLDQFRALCDEVGGIVSWEAALDYFHQTGVVFYDQDLFDNCIVLDQDWVLDAVYTVFHRSRAAPFLRDSGRFTREDLAFLAWPGHSVEEQKLFLGLMESCGVCFPVGKTAQGEMRYVAPDLLPPFEAVAGRINLNWKPEAETTTLRLEYRFFHPALVRALMRQIGGQAADLAEYWKYGFWLKDGKRDTQILVHVDTSTTQASGAGALELKAQGSDPCGLLREIYQAISWQRIGEDPEELLTLGGTTIARSSLSTRTNGRVLDTAGNWVPAEPFAAFFEGRAYRPEKLQMEAKQAWIDIAPQAPHPDEKRPAVFISYAWGDDSPEGKLRAEVVDALYAALEKDGFVPMRDRDQIRSGELISAFIRQLTRADLVVAVISDQYLRSPYCMQEIYRLWQRCQEDTAELAKCVVPIVLPDAKIGHLRDRAAYLRHWRDEALEHDRLYEEFRDQLDPETVKEIRLVREFSRHVAGILKFLQDDLMPRQLDVHLEQGFPAVISALRRRIQS